MRYFIIFYVFEKGGKTIYGNYSFENKTFPDINLIVSRIQYKKKIWNDINIINIIELSKEDYSSVNCTKFQK